MVLTIQEMDDLDLNGVQNKEQTAQITTEKVLGSNFKTFW
jgi:hypothetical protein